MVSYRFSLEFSTVIYAAWDLMKIAPWKSGSLRLSLLAFAPAIRCIICKPGRKN